MRFAFPYDTDPFGGGRASLCYGIVECWTGSAGPAVYVAGCLVSELGRPAGAVPAIIEPAVPDLIRTFASLRLDFVCHAPSAPDGRLLGGDEALAAFHAHCGRSHELAVWLACRFAGNSRPPEDERDLSGAAPALFCSGRVPGATLEDVQHDGRSRCGAARVSLAAKWLTYCAACARREPVRPFAADAADVETLQDDFGGRDVNAAAARISALGGRTTTDRVVALLHAFGWKPPRQLDSGNSTLWHEQPSLVALPTSPASHAAVQALIQQFA